MTTHFYHLHAAGYWQEPASEHFRALRNSQFTGSVEVGLVGSSDECKEAKHWLSKEWPEANICAEARVGYEQVTLNALRLYARSEYGCAEHVFYAHTKGANHPTPLRTSWRRGMTEQCVGRWQVCRALLTDYYAVGCHWLTPEMSPGLITTPMFAGNFWWTTTSYIRMLPGLYFDDPYAAEGWIGKASSKVYDLKPGLPDGMLGLATPGDV